MKISLLFVLLVPIVSFSQSKTIKSAKAVTGEVRNNSMLSFNERIELSATMFPTVWSLYYDANMNKYRPQQAPVLMDMIDDSVVKTGTDPVAKKYAPYAKKLLSHLTLFGNDLGQFLVEDSRSCFTVTKFEIDKASVLLIDGATSDNIYNTLKFTAKQRAAKVLSSNILPALKLVSSELNIPGIKYLAFSFTYGSKDFSSDDALNLKPEYLCAVFPLESLKKFAGNTLSQDELIEHSHFYLKDRDNLSANKVKLVVE